jgi:hypothetical protein
LIEATAKRPGGVHDEAAGVVPGAAIREEQRRFGMANWVLSRQRQAADRGGRSGEPFGEAMDAVLGAEAGSSSGSRATGRTVTRGRTVAGRPPVGEGQGARTGSPGSDRPNPGRLDGALGPVSRTIDPVLG